MLAVDGKVTLDDNASFRQEHARFDDVSNTDPIEARAREKHLKYAAPRRPEVGIIGNGAGLVIRRPWTWWPTPLPGVRRDQAYQLLSTSAAARVG